MTATARAAADAAGKPPPTRVRRATRASGAGATALAAVLVLLALAPFWGSRQTLEDLVEVFTLVALAEMWNLLAGYAGIVSIGQQAYVGLGAYGLVWFSDNRGLNPFLSVLLAGLLAGLVAVPSAALVFRLRAGYLAIGTWVLAEVYRLLVVNVDQLDLGAGSGTSLVALSGYSRADREHDTYWIALALAVAAVGAVYALARSRMGLGLGALRDAETAAVGLGVPAGRYRIAVYTLCAFATGVAGAVIYLDLLRVQPDAAFSIDWTADMIVIVMIGGLGTVEGPIIGAALFVVLEHMLSDQGSWYLIILGTVAVTMMVVTPEGIWGGIQRRTGFSILPVRRRLILVPQRNPAADGGPPPAERRAAGPGRRANRP